MRARTLALCLALGSVARASEALAVVRVNLVVDPPHPVVGVPFHVLYQLEVQNDRPAHATQIRFVGLRVLANAAPPSTANMMVFGGLGGLGTFTMQTSAEYILVATAPGRYVVQGASALDEQNRVVARAADLTIDVIANNTPQPPTPVQPMPGMPQMMPMPGFPPGFPPGIATPDMAPQPTADPDAPPLGDIPAGLFNPEGFVRVSVDNPTPYVGQQTTYRAWVYLPSSEAGCDASREPTLTGFWNEPLTERGQTRCARSWYPQLVGGRQMMAGLLRKIALFPTRAGRLEIGPMDVVAEYIEGDMFFGQRRHIEVRSPSLVLEAHDEPDAGRPLGYIPGLLGPVHASAELDRTTAPTGETVTLRVRARGNGYLGAVGIPAPPAVEGVRMHAGASHHEVDRSNEADVRNELVSEYLLVAERPGALSLGVLNIPWFDPSTRRYQTSTVPLPTLTATGPAIDREHDDDEHPDPATTLDGFAAVVSTDGYHTFFSSPLRVWGTVALPPSLLALSALALAITGAADMVSVVVRQHVVQLATPDAMRGRVSAVNLVFISTSNELGEFESGVTAEWFGPRLAVVLGGVGTLLVVVAWGRLFPALRDVDRLDALRPKEGPA